VARAAAAAPRYLIRFNSRTVPVLSTDVVVIGSGIAGLRAAIEASRFGRVIVVTKTGITDCNTQYAQGGIAAAMQRGDSPRYHVQDTVQAGQGLCDLRTVNLVVREGITRVKEIRAWGARFDLKGSQPDFTREGGHSRARILHAGGDATGRELERVLVERALASSSIQVLDHTFTIDLLTTREGCVGILAFDGRNGTRAIYAQKTILASGGLGQLYRETTNPEVATGDGFALAQRAGATLRDMEFVQFHPTTLYVAGATRSLISEAVRGEGALLRDRNGLRFMPAHHPSAELAPRDVVSRAIIRQMKLTEDTNAYLDVRHISPAAIKKRFPTLWEQCREFRIDIVKDMIPVRPACHYMVGGVKTDLLGRTDVANLYACGEVASTGLHGANRLGSNSLLEGLVFGARVGLDAGKGIGRRETPQPPLRHEREMDRSRFIDVEDVRNSLTSLMWRQVGVEREARGLEDALQKIDYWRSYVLTKEFFSMAAWELQDMLFTARAIAGCALRRRETRGVHFRLDYPDRVDPRWQKSSEV